MRKARKLIAITVAIVGVLAGSADARQHVKVGRVAAVSAGLPTATPLSPTPVKTDRQLRELSKLADTWWEKRGIDTCESTIPSIRKPPHEAAVKRVREVQGFAEIGSCRWSLTPWMAANTRSGWWGTTQELAYECAVGIHENGHARGLDHDDPRFLIMTEEDIWNEIIPGECWGWAKKIRDARR